MARRKIYSFAIDEELAAGLKEIKERDGIAESEQIRRAVREWLQDKGASFKAERKRVGPRRRS